MSDEKLPLIEPADDFPLLEPPFERQPPAPPADPNEAPPPAIDIAAEQSALDELLQLLRAADDGDAETEIEIFEERVPLDETLPPENINAQEDF